MVDLEFFTPAQIAEKLQWKERRVREAIIKHNIPTLGGRTDKRLDSRAVLLLIEALREPCPTKSTAGPTARIGGSRSTPRVYGAYDKVLARLTKDSQRKGQQRSKPSTSGPPGTANVVALGPSRKR